MKYGSDCSELGALISVADKLGIAILLIHHTRKEHDSDTFNMISGATKLNGCADGSFCSHPRECSPGNKLSGDFFCSDR